MLVTILLPLLHTNTLTESPGSDRINVSHKLPFFANSISSCVSREKTHRYKWAFFHAQKVLFLPDILRRNKPVNIPGYPHIVPDGFIRHLNSSTHVY